MPLPIVAFSSLLRNLSKSVRAGEQLLDVCRTDRFGFLLLRRVSFSTVVGSTADP